MSSEDDLTASHEVTPPVIADLFYASAMCICMKYSWIPVSKPDEDVTATYASSKVIHFPPITDNLSLRACPQ